MKSLSIILLAIAASFAQANGQQAFKTASLQQSENHYVISFSVAAEANIYQYRIEAGNDSTQMEVIGVVKAKGNSVSERCYRYETFDTGYAYYRIAAVGMGSQLRYSPVLSRPQQGTRPQVKPCTPSQCDPKALANRN